MATVVASPCPDVELIETDGEPLESPWHFATIALLIDSIRSYLHPRTDFFTAGNMFLYFSAAQARNRDYRGPDFFFVNGVDGLKPRRWWAIWEEEGRFPDVIMELLSPTTAEVDRTVKKNLYERTFRTPEYFCFDPDTSELEGWRLGPATRYEEIKPDERGWFWCEQWQLWIGPWTGSYLGVSGIFPRLYTATGQLVLTIEEAARQHAEAERRNAETERRNAETERRKAEAERQNAEAERRKAEAERKNADVARQNAEAERRNAETERQNAEVERLRAENAMRRAEDAEAELARLKAQLGTGERFPGA